MPDQPKVNEDIKSDVKPRGANRTTKVAGKLKVLPEQPETLPVLEDKVAIRRDRLVRDQAGSSGTAGDSDEGDVEESEEYEACCIPEFQYVPFTHVCHRSIIKYRLYRRVRLAGMRLGLQRKKQNRFLESQHMPRRGRIRIST